MRLEEYTRAKCWLKRDIDVPGDTPEEIKDNYLKGKFKIINETVDSVDDDPVTDENLTCKLQTILGEEIWTNDIPEMWDEDEILIDDLEYQIKIKNIFR